MKPSILMRVIGTQPDGIRSLQLEELVRVAPDSAARKAAELANNYWRLNGIQMTRFEVHHLIEPSDPLLPVGRVYQDDGSCTVLVLDRAADGLTTSIPSAGVNSTIEGTPGPAREEP
jgi:hypothetical protein